MGQGVETGSSGNGQTHLSIQTREVSEEKKNLFHACMKTLDLTNKESS